MRVVFMGTPDFADASLRQLISDGFDVCAVFTQPDKERGRGLKTVFSPVKESAIAHQIPVYQPESLRSDEIVDLLISFHADVIAVVAYGKLLPERVIQTARFGAVNLHGSLLPKYRGAAPIQWAVLNGDRTTGVCTFYLTAEMDAGDIIYEEETEIGELETSGELFDRLMISGASLLSRTLRDIDLGVAPRKPQGDAGASYVSKLGKNLSPIDWTRTPREIMKWICGLQPWPVATMDLCGQTVKVFAASYSQSSTDAVPGTLLSAGEKGIEVACGGGAAIYITELQLPGKKRMHATEFLRGHRIAI